MSIEKYMPYVGAAGVRKVQEWLCPHCKEWTPISDYIHYQEEHIRDGSFVALRSRSICPKCNGIESDAMGRGLENEKLHTSRERVIMLQLEPEG